MRKYQVDMVTSPKHHNGRAVTVSGLLTVEIPAEDRFEVIGGTYSVATAALDAVGKAGTWRRSTDPARADWAVAPNSMAVTLSHLLVEHVAHMDTKTAAGAMRRLFYPNNLSNVSVTVAFEHRDILQVIGVGLTEKGGWLTVLRRKPEAPESNRVLKFELTFKVSTALKKSMDPLAYSFDNFDTNIVSVDLVGRVGSIEVPE